MGFRLRFLVVDFAAWQDVAFFRWLSPVESKPAPLEGKGYGTRRGQESPGLID